jgi:hypothetical protein
MTVFMCYNAALSATTAIAAGTSYSAGAKVAIQLNIPANGYIELIEWGLDFDEDGTANAASNAALFEIAYTATGSTVSTAHTTTTVVPLDWASTLGAGVSRLSYGATTNTGFGNGALTSNTTLGMADRGYLQQTGMYRMVAPEGRYPAFGHTSARFVQFRLNTTLTVNASCYLKWKEYI